jgi:histidine ammonia-lyase
MSERRTDRFLDVARNEGLPAFLADDPGVDSGLMIAQYTAAGIVSELKRLAAPASVDSIPSSAMQEDHVSMGWAGARKLRRAVDGLGRVLAVELMTAARALDLRLADLSGPRTGIHAPGPDNSRDPELSGTHAGSDAPGPDSSRAMAPAAGTGAVHALLRTTVPGPGPDRFLAPEIDAVTRLVADGEVVAAASAAVGPLR